MLQGNKHIHHLMHFKAERGELKQQEHICSLFEANKGLKQRASVLGGSNTTTPLTLHSGCDLYTSETSVMFTNDIATFFPPC